MQIDVNLNIQYSAPKEVWTKIDDVYKAMPYWSGDEKQTGKWLGDDIALSASVEPGGIQITGEMPEDIWNKWYAGLKNKLTKALGYEIGEPEEGYGFKYWKPFRKKYADIKSIDKEKIVFQDYSMFYWNQFDRVERDITAKPPYFVFQSSLIELCLSFEESGSGAKRKTKENFRDFHKQLNHLGIRSLDLS